MRRNISLLLAVCGAFFLWKGGSTVYFWANPVIVESQEEPTSTPREGVFLGYLTIPRLNVKAPIVEGTSEASLQLGPGHLRGSSLPGEAGNSVVAAHRDTHFRALKDIEIGDDLIVRRGSDKFFYNVTRIRVVEPSDLSVLQESGESMITLITCYPFTFIGPAPQRFVVQGVMKATSLHPREVGSTD